ncbi:MAG: hypothetical protein EOP84_24310, partial [Verrucomicrobiaceae bacterium]
MSYSLVPLPRDLVNRLAPVQEATELKLGVSPCTVLDPGNPRALYIWAGEVFDKLQSKGCGERESKYAIAEALGVTKDPCWSAKAKVPLRGTTERHRVIARLTREGRWHSLWSLNWDLWLERALASVGVEQYQNRPAKPLPIPDSWIRWYESWTPSNVLGSMNQQTIVIYKPHGCVEALGQGGGTFVLTEEELAARLRTQPAPVTDSLRSCFTGHSLVTSGWSASEPYLLEFFKSTAATRIHAAKLTIIDPYPNLNGHKVLEDAYGCVASESVFHTRAIDFPTTDDLFLWMQTRHGLSCLAQTCDASHSEAFAEWLRKFCTPIDGTQDISFMNSWFDCFLSVWSKLCFNNGHQSFYVGHPVPTEAVPTKRRDQHIPWSDQRSPRHDLKAASRLLKHLNDHPGAARSWRFDLFPGAMWNSNSQHLVLPVPVWGTSGVQSLAAMRPVVESRHWAHQGMIRDVSILGLTHEAGQPVVLKAEQDNWAYELSRLMHFGKLAKTSNI